MENEEYEVKVGRHLADLVPSFMDSRRKELEALNAAFSRGDADELRKLAQRMAGFGASYGFERIAQLGTELEAAARQGDHDAVASLLLRTGDYLSRVRIKISD
jgi:HPt (histidine-containing phosphotransfer) domain-containing protein